MASAEGALAIEIFAYGVLARSRAVTWPRAIHAGNRRLGIGSAAARDAQIGNARAGLDRYVVNQNVGRCGAQQGGHLAIDAGQFEIAADRGLRGFADGQGKHSGSLRVGDEQHSLWPEGQRADRLQIGLAGLIQTLRHFVGGLGDDGQPDNRGQSKSKYEA